MFMICIKLRKQRNICKYFMKLMKLMKIMNQKRRWFNKKLKMPKPVHLYTSLVVIIVRKSLLIIKSMLKHPIILSVLHQKIRRQKSYGQLLQVHLNIQNIKNMMLLYDIHLHKHFIYMKKQENQFIPKYSFGQHFSKHQTVDKNVVPRLVTKSQKFSKKISWQQQKQLMRLHYKKIVVIQKIMSNLRRKRKRVPYRVN
eukprot:g2384.t1